MFSIQDKKFTIKSKKSKRYIGQKDGTRNITQKEKFHQEGDFWTLSKIRENTYFIKNVKTGNLMDVEGGSTTNLAKIIDYPKHGGENQQFILEKLSDSTFKITNIKSKKVFDIEGARYDEGARLFNILTMEGIIKDFF